MFGVSGAARAGVIPPQAATPAAGVEMDGPAALASSAAPAGTAVVALAGIPHGAVAPVDTALEAAG